MRIKRRYLRKKLTGAEATLWSLLKNRQLEGRKFRRQHSVGKCVLELLSFKKLAIELDGEHHFTDQGLSHGKKRTNYLTSLKIQVIRFENEEVFQSPSAVLAEIKKHFKGNDF